MLRQLWRDKGGGAAIEFGLVAPFLSLLIVATVEIGTGIYQGMQAQNAAEAGAVYASKYGFDADGISNAVVAATEDAGIVASPSPTQFCGCPSSAGITVMQCSSACPGDTAPGYYLRINAQITHDPLLSIPGLAAPATITGEAVVRIY